MRLKQGMQMKRSTSRLTDNSRSAGNSSVARALGVFVIVVSTLTACISLQQRAARSMFEAWRSNAPLPLAHSIDETLTIESAYQIQREYVLRRQPFDKPAGFKAGLTSPGSQARFGAKDPIAGVLIVPPLRSPATVRLSELRGLNIETEVALRIGRSISKRVGDIDELQKYIDGVAPAIELPNLDYAGTPAQLTVPDIVASNVGAAQFVVGEFVPPESRNPNDAAPRLTCAEKEVNAGNARDALGDQWAAALWLINTMIDRGWTFEPGQILMTGALGRMVPAQPGHCVASYGGWGTLEVTVL